METLKQWVALVLVCLALCMPFLGCGGRNADTNAPIVATSPYVRLATYNAVIAESNLAAVKAVRSAAELQLISPELTKDIFAWQARVARTSKTLAIALSDSSVDVKSEQIVNLVLELAAPPVFDSWLTGLTGEQQRLVLSSLRALSAAIALAVREFGTRESAGAAFAPQHPRQANLDAWYRANMAEAILGVPPQPGRLVAFGRLWRAAHGFASN